MCEKRRLVTVRCLVLLKEVSSSKSIHHYCLKSNKSGTFDHSRFPSLIFENTGAHESFLAAITASGSSLFNLCGIEDCDVISSARMILRQVGISAQSLLGSVEPPFTCESKF